jgi:ketosteroid isomerase-like protein
MPPLRFRSNIGKGMSVNDRDIIERQRAEYIDAFNRQDIRTMTGYIAADIDAMAPSRPAIRGIDAQIQFWHEGFAAARSVLFVLPDDLELMGDVAVDRHRWVLDSLAKRDGRPVHDEGKGIWIWRRQVDGGWKIGRSIWNSDLPRASLSSGPGVELSEDLAGINQLLDDLVGAVNTGDAQAWSELMPEDVTFAVPDLPQFVGKQAAVSAAKAGFFDPFVLRLASKYEDVQIFGTHAFAHTVFVLDRIPRAGGKTVTIPGKCTSFLRKQSDGWKHVLIIFSYDQPAREVCDFPIRAALLDGHLGALPVAASSDLSPSFFPRTKAAFAQSCRSLTD